MDVLDSHRGNAADGCAAMSDGPPEFVALQPVGIVDHLCAVDEATLKSLLQGSVGLDSAHDTTCITGASNCYHAHAMIVKAGTAALSPVTCAMLMHCRTLVPPQRGGRQQPGQTGGGHAAAVHGRRVSQQSGRLGGQHDARCGTHAVAVTLQHASRPAQRLVMALRLAHRGEDRVSSLSMTNNATGLATGFGVRCGIVGARGLDENGAFFQSSLKRSHVRTERLRVMKGDSTGALLVQCLWAAWFCILIWLWVVASCLRGHPGCPP